MKRGLSVTDRPLCFLGEKELVWIVVFVIYACFI